MARIDAGQLPFSGIVGKRLLWLLLLVAAAAPAALAQSISPLDPPDTSRYLKWGPFRVRPGLTIPNLGYDSNVFYRPDTSTEPQVGDYREAGPTR